MNTTGRPPRSRPPPHNDDGEPEDPSADAESGGWVRLNKFMAELGVASRRKCDELIQSGKVSIDGEPATELGTKIDPLRHVVDVGGVVLKPDALRRRYYLLNKPRGVICTNEAREARTRAIDLITDRNKGRIFSVGRLDEDSSGLLILTNDGEFTNQIAHPRHSVPKTYLVKVRGRIDEEALARISEGVRLSEGRTSGAALFVERRSNEASLLTVTIREGKNREIRRVFAAMGYKVLRLHRVRIGALSDRRLKDGEWRPLTPEEVADLLDVANNRERAEKLFERAAHGSFGSKEVDAAARGRAREAERTGARERSHARGRRSNRGEEAREWRVPKDLRIKSGSKRRDHGGARPAAGEDVRRGAQTGGRPERSERSGRSGKPEQRQRSNRFSGEDRKQPRRGRRSR